MKQKHIILIIVGFLLVILISTNPSNLDYKDAVKNEVLNTIELNNEDKKNDIESLGENVGVGIGLAFFDKFYNDFIERENFIFFSFNKTKEMYNAATGSEDGNKIISIGIFGKIFFLRKYDVYLKDFFKEGDKINGNYKYSADAVEVIKEENRKESLVYQSLNDIVGKPFKIDNIIVAQYDFNEKMNWDDAVNSCEYLGNDWRLPTISELDKLYMNNNDYGRFAKYCYWSSTVNTNGAISKSFTNVISYCSESKSSKFKVRCVKNR